MSTNILETETFSITRFFGGRYRGVCYQINVAGSPGYVQLTRDEAVLLRSALTDELFGDPSEATPTKENAPHKVCQCLECKALRDFGLTCGDGEYSCATCGMGMEEPCEHWKQMAKQVSEDAPAPEVQGTPTISSGQLRYQDMMGTGETPLPEKDVLMERVAKYYPEMLPKTAVPVGTPQKETPPGFCELCKQPMPEGEEMFKYHGYSGPCPVKEFVHENDCDCSNDSDGEGNVVEHSEDCKNCTCEKSAPVPEGVQGKEPRRRIRPAGLFLLEHPQLTKWQEIGQAEQRRDGLWLQYGAICTLLRDKENVTYSLGEAAGRRSAITELQERIAAYYYGNFNAKIALAWCAELQEKTK